MNAREVQGARQLLHLLLEEEVVSLAQTVTKGQIETPSKEGSLAFSRFSPDACTFRDMRSAFLFMICSDASLKIKLSCL